MGEVAVNAAAHPSFDRAHGATKIGIRRCLSLAQRLMVMAGGNVSTQTAARFAAVGALGLCVDYAVFEALTALGLRLPAAQVSSFLCAMLSNYALNSRWTFSNYPARSVEAEWRICGRFVTISLMGVLPERRHPPACIRSLELAASSGLVSRYRDGGARQLSRQRLLCISSGRPAGFAKGRMARCGHWRVRLRSSSAARLHAHVEPHSGRGLLLELLSTSRFRLSRPSANGCVAHLALDAYFWRK